MSQYPTCPVHMLMKPCIHCDKPQEYAAVACGDISKGKLVENCSCGLVREFGRPCGYKIKGLSDWYT